MTDLSKIPPPEALETLSSEAIRDEILQDLEPTLGPLLPSSPIHQAVEVFAYRELYLRARINDAVKAAFLPTAWGTNLDSIGARDDLERLVLDPGDETTVPPTSPALEGDEDYRSRILEASRAIGAGVVEAYESAARRAHPGIIDVMARRSGPAAAQIWYLAPGEDTEVIDEFITESIESVRVLTDEVTIQNAFEGEVPTAVTIYVAPGPDLSVVLEAAQKSVTAWATASRRINRPIFGSELIAAASVPGVVHVEHDLEDREASLVFAYHVVPTITAVEAPWRT